MMHVDTPAVEMAENDGIDATTWMLQGHRLDVPWRTDPGIRCRD
jgi:hypothetical protein